MTPPPSRSAAAPASQASHAPQPFTHGGKAVSNARLAFMLAASIAITPLAVDMYLPAFPTLAQAFGTDVARIQFTLSVFFIGLAIGQLIYGPLADRFGRRPMLLTGLSIYAAASVVCALATSVEALVVGRLLQAFGSCAGMVIAMAVVRDRFAPREGAVMMSRMTLIMGAAPIFAPLVGGVLLLYFGWQSIFWALGGYGAMVLAAIAMLLPESRNAQTKGPANPWQALKVYGGLVKHRRYVGLTMARAFCQAGLFIYISGSPFVFIQLHGVPAQYFGLLFGLNGIAIIGASQVNVWLLRRYKPEQVLRGALAGLLTTALLMVCAAFLPPSFGVTGFVCLLAPLWFFMGASGLIQPNSTVLALAPFGDRAGSAAGLMGLLIFALAGIASAIVATVHASSALPMAGGIAVCAVLALGFYWLLAAPGAPKAEG